MRREKRGRRKLNNQGVSLVELLVAIVILAIIVAPLLRAFVISTRTNVKAKERLRANDVAQNVLEGIEPLSIENILYQYNYPVAEPEKGYAGFTIADINGTKTCELRMNTDSSSGAVSFVKARNLKDFGAEVTNPEDMMDCSLDAKGKFRPRDGYDHKLYLWAEDMDGFNALVTIDAHLANADTSEIYDTRNTEGKVNLNKVSNDSDAVSMDATLPTELLTELRARNYKNKLGNDLEQEDIDRKIEIKIEKSAATGATVATVTYRYTFEDSHGDKVIFPAEGSADELNYSNIIFDNAVDKTKEIRNIYVFYSPWYVSTVSSVPNTPDYPYKDVIVVDNPADLDVNLFLVKQNLGLPGLQVSESNYVVCLDVKEPDHVHIKTNLNWNMAFQKADGSYDASSVLSQIRDKSGFVYTDIEPLTELEVKDHLYEVRVDIYRKDVSISDLADADVKPVVSITGGLLD